MYAIDMTDHEVLIAAKQTEAPGYITRPYLRGWALAELERPAREYWTSARVAAVAALGPDVCPAGEHSRAAFAPAMRALHAEALALDEAR